MTPEQTAARVERLDELARGLDKELVQVRQADDPLLGFERKVARDTQRGEQRPWCNWCKLV